MKKIKLRNKYILGILEEFRLCITNLDSETFDSEDNMVLYHGCHEEGLTSDYLYKEIEKGDEHDGFPECIRGIMLDEHFGRSDHYNKEKKREYEKITFQITQYLTAKRNALCAYYPPGGYITWHTNWNASGYNVMMSYSEDGSGSFSYLDPETKEIIKIQDEPGVWTAKVGRFGNFKDGPHLWHKAEAGNSRRFTFSYVIDNKTLWEMMIEDLEDPDGY